MNHVNKLVFVLQAIVFSYDYGSILGTDNYERHDPEHELD